MFGGKRRVEEDLGRIRGANLPNNAPPPDSIIADGIAGKAPPPQDPAGDDYTDAGAKTIFSIVVAVFSLILPYLGAVAALLFLFWLAFRLMA